MLLEFLACILKIISRKMKQENYQQMWPQDKTFFEGMWEITIFVIEENSCLFFIQNKDISKTIFKSMPYFLQFFLYRISI